MGKRKSKAAGAVALKNYCVRFRSTTICEVMIDAIGENEAREKFERGDWGGNGSVRELDSVDSELLSLTEES